MRKNILAGILFCITSIVYSQNYDHHFLLAGASFAVPENGWFELACEAFNAEAINKAVSGEAIKHTASDMFNNNFYTAEELERIDAFIIMHVHNQDVADTDGIKENYEDYTYEEIQQYHLAYDYVIKRYKADCYNLKNDPDSKYYQSENGKPATIILCTHWHDSRTTYNESIRTLAERWQLPLIKLDDNIGFTRNELDPDGQQPSIKYSCDTETIYRVVFGWHPLRGKEQYIQQKIAQICMEELAKLFKPVDATAKISEKSKLIATGEDAYVICTFTGVPPWNLTYSVNGQEIQQNDILENPQIIKINTTAETTTVKPVSVNNANTENGEVSGEVNIRICDQSITPSFDTYVHQANKTNDYADDNHLEVKGNSDTHTRETFISFNTDEINPDAERIVLRAYYYDCIYPGWPLKETHRIEIAGNTKQYTSLTWDTKPNDFIPIGECPILGNELNSYIDWDVTDWTKEQITAGKSTITFRLRFGDTTGTGLLYFHSSESEQPNKPQLLIYSSQASACSASKFTNIEISTLAANKEITIKGIKSPSRVSCYSLCGQTLFSGQTSDNGKIKLPDCFSGIYVLRLHNEQQQYACKIVL